MAPATVSTTFRKRRRSFRKVGVPVSEKEEEGIALTPAVRAKRFSEVPVTRRKWVGANVERRELAAADEAKFFWWRLVQRYPE